MTILIGITGSPEETVKNLRKEFKGTGTRTLVGPFISPEQAEEWKEFMKARNEACREITVPTGTASPAGWYGFTFELGDFR